jgi:hypothetical protein
MGKYGPVLKKKQYEEKIIFRKINWQYKSR